MPALATNTTAEEINVMYAGNDEVFPPGEKRLIDDGLHMVIAREHPGDFDVRPVTGKAVSAALRAKADQDSEELARVSEERDQLNAEKSELELRVAELEAEKDGRTFTREKIPEGLAAAAKADAKKKDK